MATFDLNGKSIYYETHGEGDPFIVLNGIMMSTPSWAEFVEPFSAHNRLILVDFLDQGRSDRMNKSEKYSQNIQVEVVKGLLDELSLDKASILGISYGGEIALQFAIKYPDMVEKLMLFNTAARTGDWLADIGKGWILAGEDAESYYYATIPVIYSPAFYRNNYAWMERRKKVLCGSVFSDKTFIDSMERLTISSFGYDVTKRLSEIKAPTLVVSGEQDYLIPIEEQRIIAGGIPQSHHVIIPDCGHASMYEQPEIFASLALGFLLNPKMKFSIV